MEVFKLGNHYLKGIDLKNIKFNNDVEEEKRCFARLWGDGSFGNDRCEKSIKVGCLCKKHFEASQRMNGGWWSGMINEERPEELEGIKTKGAEKRIKQLIRQRKERDEELQQLRSEIHGLRNQVQERDTQLSSSLKNMISIKTKMISISYL